MTTDTPTPAAAEPLPLIEDFELISSADDRGYQEVDVPEWKGRIRLQAQSADDASAFIDAMFEDTQDDAGKMKRTRRAGFSNAHVQATIICLCAVKKDGTKLFPDLSLVKRLGAKSAAAMTRVSDAAFKLNGLSDAAVTDAKNGSSGTDTGASSSASHDDSAKPSEN